MPKRHDYRLNETELEQVQRAMKHGNARLAKRATVIHSLHLGYSAEEVAHMQGLTRGSVYNQFNRFKQEGIAGLPDKPKRGRPAKATEAYIELLEQTLATDPHELGYAFTLWTQARLRHYLAQRLGIDLSRSRFQELMQRLGYGYRRPKRDLGHKQDPLLRQQVEQALDALKKEPKTPVLSYSLWMKVSSD